MPSQSSDRSVASPVVSIIMVSFNTAEMTAACLRSIAEQTPGLAHEVIVVDNASSDGSVDAIRDALPSARLIALNDNIGFARANNLAVQEARGEFVLLLNPDTLVLDRAIERLTAFARCCPDAGIWGGRTVFGDGSLNPGSCWRRMSLWNLACRALGFTALFKSSEVFNGEAYGGWQRDDVRAVDIVTGCFLLIKRTMWHDLGGFDPAFFMYGEEADLCLRAAALGARPLVTPDAEIVHYGGASERVRADKLVRLLSGKVTLIQRHFSAAARGTGVALLAAWPLTRMTGLSIAAAVTGSKPHKESARTWQEVWLRRREWISGYPKPDTSSATTKPQSAIAPSTAG